MDKDRQIVYQVAFKGAIELMAAGKVSILQGAEVAPQVKALTDDLYGFLAEATGLAGVPQAVPASAQVVDPVTPLVTEGVACPTCQAEGRNGVLIQNTDPTYRGPEFKCSLQQSRKVGSAWVEVGQCEYVDWGRNSKR